MDHKGEFCRIIGELARRYDRHEVFNDFCEIAAITLRQVFERNPANEERYLKLIRRYEPEEQKQFARLLALTAQALTEKPRDFLGECFHELEMHNQYKGQFFTPFDVSRMMAKMSLAGFEEKIRAAGFIELNEPTCGSGGMVIAAVEEVKAAGFNPVHVFFAVAQDIDRKCCNMTYIQLSLLAVPAAVIWEIRCWWNAANSGSPPVTSSDRGPNAFAGAGCSTRSGSLRRPPWRFRMSRKNHRRLRSPPPSRPRWTAPPGS